MAFIGVMEADAFDQNGDEDGCETVYTTVTVYDPPTPSTFVYTKTEIVPAHSINVVTKVVDKPETLVFVTEIVPGSTKHVTVATTTINYQGATTTSTSITTVTIFPYATTSTTVIEYILFSVEGTLTLTYPTPAVTVLSRYTGAPTSLWLSVI